MSCKLQPKAAKDEFVEISEGRMKIRITAPPVDGKANKHLIKFLAKQFKVAQSNIDIISGETSKLKRIRISTPQVVPEALRRLAPEIAQVMDKQ
ncbi:MAG: DUF167 family protein [Pseudohongiellaceae bacterium]|nr:DUF167 family protein [Pseudohongiellaceae bacterium]